MRNAITLLPHGCYHRGQLYPAFCCVRLSGMLNRRSLEAEVVYNGMGTPRADGAVVVQGEGDEAVIVAVDERARARENFPDAEVVEAGFALSPPPVNAHTHLDLSKMTFEKGSYEGFIRRVIAHKQTWQGGGLEAARAGVAELRADGVNTVGDIVTQESVMEYLLTEPTLQGVACWEVIGPNPEDAERIFEETVDTLRRFRAWERPDGVKLGLSPHTPHTVSAPLLQRLTKLATASHLPLQIHVAESAGEVAMHQEGTGPLMEMMRGFFPHWQPSGRSPVGYLESLGVLEARPTLVHMVHVTEEDVRTVARAGCVAVHCPRSNEALGCGRFPWELYMKHGVEVGFGTDSRGSSPNLSIHEEVAAARALHGDRASPLALVRGAVKGGYKALHMTPPRFARGDAAAGLHVWR